MEIRILKYNILTAMAMAASYNAYLSAKKKYDERRQSRHSSAIENSVSRIPFICQRCDYPFKMKTEDAGISYNLRCPYCGKADQLAQA